MLKGIPKINCMLFLNHLEYMQAGMRFFCHIKLQSIRLYWSCCMVLIH